MLYVAVGSVGVGSIQGFQTAPQSSLATDKNAFQPTTTTTRTKSSSLKASEKESVLPENSFGAEVVPEGQRPVNEYLNMAKSPMFGWANEDAGTKGLLTRLAILYGVVFATM